MSCSHNISRTWWSSAASPIHQLEPVMGPTGCPAASEHNPWLGTRNSIAYLTATGDIGAWPPAHSVSTTVAVGGYQHPMGKVATDEGHMGLRHEPSLITEPGHMRSCVLRGYCGGLEVTKLVPQALGCVHINLGKTKDLVLMYGLQDLMQITPRHGQTGSGQWRLRDIEDAHLMTAIALALVHFRHSHSHSQMVTTMWPRKPLRYSSSRSMHSHFRWAANPPKVPFLRSLIHHHPLHT